MTCRLGTAQPHKYKVPLYFGYATVSARQLLFVWCSLSDDWQICQMPHQTPVISNQTSVRHRDKNSSILGRHMYILLWCKNCCDVLYKTTKNHDLCKATSDFSGSKRFPYKSYTVVYMCPPKMNEFLSLCCQTSTTFTPDIYHTSERYLMDVGHMSGEHLVIVQ